MPSPRRTRTRTRRRPHPGGGRGAAATYPTPLNGGTVLCVHLLARTTPRPPRSPVSPSARGDRYAGAGYPAPALRAGSRTSSGPARPGAQRPAGRRRCSRRTPRTAAAGAPTGRRGRAQRGRPAGAAALNNRARSAAKTGALHAAALASMCGQVALRDVRVSRARDRLRSSLARTIRRRVDPAASAEGMLATVSYVPWRSSAKPRPARADCAASSCRSCSSARSRRAPLSSAGGDTPWRTLAMRASRRASRTVDDRRPRIERRRVLPWNPGALAEAARGRRRAVSSATASTAGRIASAEGRRVAVALFATGPAHPGRRVRRRCRRLGAGLDGGALGADLELDRQAVLLVVRREQSVPPPPDPPALRRWLLVLLLLSPSSSSSPSRQGAPLRAAAWLGEGRSPGAASSSDGVVPSSPSPEHVSPRPPAPSSHRLRTGSTVAAAEPPAGAPGPHTHAPHTYALASNAPCGPTVGVPHAPDRSFLYGGAAVVLWTRSAAPARERGRAATTRSAAPGRLRRRTTSARGPPSRPCAQRWRAA